MLKTFWANHKFGFRDSSTRVSGRSPALKQYLFDICCFALVYIFFKELMRNKVTVTK